MIDNAENKVYVVNIHDDSTVMLNIGTDDGVKIGDIYSIYEIGEEIFDPNTGNSLGNIEIPKGIGKIVHIQKSMSMLKSTVTRMRKVKRTPNTILGMYGYSSLGPSGAITEEEEEALPFNDPKIKDIAIKLR